jgi:hypothetical protein
MYERLVAAVVSQNIRDLNLAAVRRVILLINYTNLMPRGYNWTTLFLGEVMK